MHCSKSLFSFILRSEAQNMTTERKFIVCEYIAVCQKRRFFIKENTAFRQSAIGEISKNISGIAAAIPLIPVYFPAAAVGKCERSAFGAMLSPAFFHEK